MAETLANRYLLDRTPQELFNEYQHGRSQRVFEFFCVHVTYMKVASASKRLKAYCFHNNSFTFGMHTFSQNVVHPSSEEIAKYMKTYKFGSNV